MNFDAKVIYYLTSNNTSYADVNSHRACILRNKLTISE